MVIERKPSTDKTKVLVDKWKKRTLLNERSLFMSQVGTEDK